MKTKWVLPLVGSLAWMFAGCMGTPTRSATAPTETTAAAWPQAVQQKVLAGEVAVGFTQEQVRAALGPPDYRNPGLEGASKGEIWGYRDSRPRSHYGFRPVFASAQKTSADSSAAPNTPKFVIVFDREGRVTAIENVWW